MDATPTPPPPTPPNSDPAPPPPSAAAGDEAIEFAEDAGSGSRSQPEFAEDAEAEESRLRRSAAEAHAAADRATAPIGRSEPGVTWTASGEAAGEYSLKAPSGPQAGLPASASAPAAAGDNNLDSELRALRTESAAGRQRPVSPVVTFDEPCGNCRYNLRGLPWKGKCPECGTDYSVWGPGRALDLAGKKALGRKADNPFDLPPGVTPETAARFSVHPKSVIAEDVTCGHCRQNLRGLTAVGRCPECGHDYDVTPRGVLRGGRIDLPDPASAGFWLRPALAGRVLGTLAFPFDVSSAGWVVGAVGLVLAGSADPRPVLAWGTLVGWLSLLIQWLPALPIRRAAGWTDLRLTGDPAAMLNWSGLASAVARLLNAATWGALVFGGGAGPASLTPLQAVCVSVLLVPMSIASSLWRRGHFIALCSELAAGVSRTDLADQLDRARPLVLWGGGLSIGAGLLWLSGRIGGHPLAQTVGAMVGVPALLTATAAVFWQLVVGFVLAEALARSPAPDDQFVRLDPPPPGTPDHPAALLEHRPEGELP
jgi:Zn finger protein HypA/HybF involved in hydrogenase expression